MNELKTTICIIKRIIVILKTLFWKNNDIIYINSNKKILEKQKISNYFGKKTKILNCQKITTKQNLKFYKMHFARMNYNLFHIARNTLNCPNIKYGGFVSTPFSFYDGYILGNTHNYSLIEFDKNNQNTYLIDYKKELEEIVFNKKINSQEVNIIINSSFRIFKNNIPNRSKDVFEYNCLIPESQRIKNEDLNKLYNWLTSVFNHCAECGVKKINLFLCSRQSLSFIAGTAYQSYHPDLFVYEFNGNNYNWKLDVKNHNIITVVN